MRIEDFHEKVENPPEIEGKSGFAFASMGIYVFRTDTLSELLTKDAEDLLSTHDFGKDVIPSAVRSKRVYVFNFIDKNKKEVKYWRDVGNIDSYYEANMDLVEIEPIFNLYDQDWPIRTYQEQMPPAKTVHNEEDRRGIAINSIISHGAIISGGVVERSIISPGVRINSYSHVLESILMDQVEIGRGCRIRRAIIDKRNYIPENTVIGYSPEEDRKRFIVSERGVVVIPKESFPLRRY
jgi:glucose-1-phosphate adenylyltransferase